MTVGSSSPDFYFSPQHIFVLFPPPLSSSPGGQNYREFNGGIMSNKRRLPTSLFLSTGVPDTRLVHGMHLRDVCVCVCDNGGGYSLDALCGFVWELWVLAASSWICIYSLWGGCIMCVLGGDGVLEESLWGFTCVWSVINGCGFIVVVLRKILMN